MYRRESPSHGKRQYVQKSEKSKKDGTARRRAGLPQDRIRQVVDPINLDYREVQTRADPYGSVPGLLVVVVVVALVVGVARESTTADL